MLMTIKRVTTVPWKESIVRFIKFIYKRQFNPLCQHYYSVKWIQMLYNAHTK